MARPLPDEHPTFGRCITLFRQRRASKLAWIVALALLGLLGPIGLLGGAIAWAAGDIVTGGLCIAVGAVFLGLPVPILRHLFRVVEFYEGGAVERRFGRRREIPYAGSTELTFSLFRMYVEGRYETIVTIRFTPADGRVLGVRTEYTEHPRGFAVIESSRPLRGDDPYDTVRDLVAGCVAESELKRFGPEGAVWCNKAFLTAAGLTPVSGPLKGTLIRWPDISCACDDRGKFSLTRIGEARPFLTMSINDQNFYPGLEVFNALSSAGGSGR